MCLNMGQHQHPLPGGRTNPVGMMTQHGRQVIDVDGQNRSEFSMTVGTDDGFVNMPTIYDGVQLDPQTDMDRIFDLAEKRGEIQGPFPTQREAIDAARARSSGMILSEPPPIAPDRLGINIGRESNNPGRTNMLPEFLQGVY